jgi:hypothetical protein
MTRQDLEEEIAKNDDMNNNIHRVLSNIELF